MLESPLLSFSEFLKENDKQSNSEFYISNSRKQLQYQNQIRYAVLWMLWFILLWCSNCDVYIVNIICEF